LYIKQDLENLRNDYQSSIDILNRENKRLIESLEELSNNEENLKTEVIILCNNSLCRFF